MAAKKTSEPPTTTVEKEAEKKQPSRKFAAVLSRRETVVKLKLMRPVWSWEQVAKSAGVSESGARKIWKEWSEEGQLALSREEAVALFHEHLKGLQLLRTEIAEVAENAYQDSVKIAALRELATLLREEIALRQKYGQIPRNLGYLSVEVDYRYLSTVVVSIFEKHDLLEGPVGQDLLAALEAQLPKALIEEENKLDALEEPDEE